MQYLIAVIFTAITIIIYKVTTDWMSLARINAFMWLFFCWAYILIYPYDSHSAGLIWLILLCVIFAFGECVGEKVKVRKTYAVKQTAYARSKDDKHFKVVPSLWLLVILMVFLAVVASFMQLKSRGYGISVFFNLEEFVKMNAEVALDRYTGGDSVGFLINVLSSFRYSSALLSGYLINVANKKRYKFICCLVIIPVLMDMAINNTKLGIISSLVLFIIGYFTGYMFFKGRAPKLTFKFFFIAVIAMLALFVVLICTLVVRQGEVSGKTFSAAIDRFGVYAVGHMEAFNYWLSEVYKPGNYSLGVNTFMGPFSLLGIVHREQGVYELIEGLSTNVFTSYRGVISDWGVIGGLIVMFILGIIGGISKKSILNNGRMKTVYAAIAFTVLLSFVVSPWVFNSYWIAFIIFMCALGYNSLVVNMNFSYAKKSQGKSAL